MSRSWLHLRNMRSLAPCCISASGVSNVIKCSLESVILLLKTPEAVQTDKALLVTAACLGSYGQM